MVSLSEPLGSSDIRGQILVTRKLANLFLPMKTPPPPVCPLNTRPHMYVENVPVCTGTTRTCFNTYTTQTTHHTTTQDTTPHGDRQRQTETDTEGEEETKEKTTRQEQREEREEWREREIHFQCGGAWPFFDWCSDFLVNSVCARDLSLLNSVKYDSSAISFSVLCPVNSFSKFLRIIFLCSVSVIFFFEIFLLMQLQF